MMAYEVYTHYGHNAFMLAFEHKVISARDFYTELEPEMLREKNSGMLILSLRNIPTIADVEAHKRSVRPRTTLCSQMGPSVNNSTDASRMFFVAFEQGARASEGRGRLWHGLGGGGRGGAGGGSSPRGARRSGRQRVVLPRTRSTRPRGRAPRRDPEHMRERRTRDLERERRKVLSTCVTHSRCLD